MTPEMSTNIVLTSVASRAWRETVTTLPPPSRRNGAVPASVASDWSGRIVTLLAPVPRIVSGLVIVRPLREPACDGEPAPLAGVEDSW